ncbi:hypothetical protein GINT2_001006 [Glugoides intestinalis]
MLAMIFVICMFFTFMYLKKKFKMGSALEQKVPAKTSPLPLPEPEMNTQIMIEEFEKYVERIETGVSEIKNQNKIAVNTCEERSERSRAFLYELLKNNEQFGNAEELTEIADKISSLQDAFEKEAQKISNSTYYINELENTVEQLKASMSTTPLIYEDPEVQLYLRKVCTGLETLKEAMGKRVLEAVKIQKYLEEPDTNFLISLKTPEYLMSDYGVQNCTKGVYDVNACNSKLIKEFMRCSFKIKVMIESEDQKKYFQAIKKVLYEQRKFLEEIFLRNLVLWWLHDTITSEIKGYENNLDEHTLFN